MTKKHGENHRSFTGIPKPLLKKMDSIYTREDIDYVEKVFEIDKINTYLSNEQIADFFGYSISWVLTKRLQKRRPAKKLD